MTTETKPRSFRLNQNHRADILKAVMERWEETNPPPFADNIAEEFFKKAIAYYRVERKGLAPKFRAFAQTLKRSAKMTKLVASLDEEERKLVCPKTTSYFFIRVFNEKGISRGEYHFNMPAVVADELGIPYLAASKEAFYKKPEYWKDHIVEGPNNYCYMITPNIISQSNLVIQVPDNFAPYQEYLTKQKALHEWKKERDRMSEEVSDYLNQFNTTGQLRESWPEIEPFLPAHVADPNRVIQLPALAKSRLNERLGL